MLRRAIFATIEPVRRCPRIVVVGPTDPVLQDVHATAIGGGLMSGPELQANAIDTFLRGAPLRGIPGWIGLALTISLGLTPALLRRRWLLSLVVGAGYLIVAYAAFDRSARIVPVLAPMTALTLSRPGRANLAVYDLRGARVRQLMDSNAMGAGEHHAAWDGTSTSGARMGPGLYFIRLDTALGSRSKRLVRVTP